MNYFEPKITTKPVISTNSTQKWVLDKPYTSEKKQLEKPFTLKEYKKNKSNYLLFSLIDDEFFCANKTCKSTKVECIWYHHQGYDLRVDETFGEFYCPECKKYTFVDYYRDEN